MEREGIMPYRLNDSPRGSDADHPAKRLNARHIPRLSGRQPLVIPSENHRRGVVGKHLVIGTDRPSDRRDTKQLAGVGDRPELGFASVSH